MTHTVWLEERVDEGSVVAMALPIRLRKSLRREFLLSWSSLTDFHCSFILKYSSLVDQWGKGRR